MRKLRCIEMSMQNQGLLDCMDYIRRHYGSIAVVDGMHSLKEDDEVVETVKDSSWAYGNPERMVKFYVEAG
jgi:hypothetical protein